MTGPADVPENVPRFHRTLAHVEGENALMRAAIESVGTHCRVIHGGWQPGTTCRDIRDSAARALSSGAQPANGPQWGLEPGSDSRAWTERVVSGDRLCWGCVLADALARIDNRRSEPSAR